VFAERGYERATLDDLAAAAGLTKGAVYSSFASKDELLLELMKERIGERLDLVREAAENATTLADLTASVGGSLQALLSAQRDWQLLFVEFWSQAVRNEALRVEFAEHRRRTREVIGELVERMTDDAGVELLAPPEALAVAILGLANGIALEQIADPELVSPAILSLTLQLVIRGAIADPGLVPTQAA